jgi:hypothetical protein
MTQYGFRPVFAADPELLRRMRGLSRDFLADVEKARPVVISVDRVAKYYWQGTDKDDWDIERDFPCVVPRWPLAFFEYRAPPRIVTTKGSAVFNRTAFGNQFGVLLESQELSPVPECGFRELPRFPRDALWIQKASLFVEFGESDIRLMGSVSWLAGDDGAFVPMGADGEGSSLCGFAPPLEGDWSYKRMVELHHACWCFIRPACLAISFLDCRHSKLMDNPVQPRLTPRLAAPIPRFGAASARNSL